MQQNPNRICRRCLLEELGETDYVESVRRYRARDGGVAVFLSVAVLPRARGEH